MSVFLYTYVTRTHPCFVSAPLHPQWRLHASIYIPRNKIHWFLCIRLERRLVLYRRWRFLWLLQTVLNRCGLQKDILRVLRADAWRRVALMMKVLTMLKCCYGWDFNLSIQKVRLLIWGHWASCYLEWECWWQGRNQLIFWGGRGEWLQLLVLPNN